MRDIYIALIVAGLLPAAFLRPFVGVILWTWMSLLAPHRLAWGFAFDFPFVQIIALVTFLGILISPERKSFPASAPTVWFILFTLWIFVTTVFALAPELAQDRLVYVLKVFALAYVALLVTNTRERLHVLVWTIVISVGFYGVKGGVFTLLSGGGARVYGPAGSYIEDNNHMALALIMVVPLLRYLQLNSGDRLVRIGLGGAMGLMIISALGSYSRGAFLALSVTVLTMLLQTRRKMLAGVIMVGALVGGLLFLPQDWFDRMGTIETYEEDASTQGRFEIWGLSTEIALDRPLVGGGLDVLFSYDTYVRYDSTIRPRSAHSIIFQVLGEHGFVGLFLFVGMGLATWLKGWRIRKLTKDRPDLRWAFDLASMWQVSLTGYCAAGLFLNLAFFDLVYLLIPIAAGTTALVLEQTRPAPAAIGARPLPGIVPQPAFSPERA